MSTAWFGRVEIGREETMLLRGTPVVAERAPYTTRGGNGVCDTTAVRVGGGWLTPRRTTTDDATRDAVEPKSEGPKPGGPGRRRPPLRRHRIGDSHRARR
ncbi:MAG: hypothetical protein ABEJ43_07010, partial [Haloferacaceae archaeon]